MFQGFWKDFSSDTYVQKQLRKGRTTGYETCLAGAEAIIRRSYCSVERILVDVERSCIRLPINGAQYYAETRNRSHFAMNIARKCASQEYVQAPLLDPLLMSLDNTAGERHPLLLDALILTRYHADLATLPFEGGRSIPEETLVLARELNQQFPRIKTPWPNGNEEAAGTWEFMQTAGNELPPDDAVTTQQPMDEQLRQAFESPTVQRVAKQLFGKSAEELVTRNRDRDHPDANKYALVAIAKAYEDTRLGKNACKDFESFVETCC